MSRNKSKLELTWIGKDKRPRPEPRILLEDPQKSCHAKKLHSDQDIFDNMIIHGDNLLALLALEAQYAGQIKCIYIDPPYNTGNAFENYEDGVEHSIWLSLMRDRLLILHNLLSENGFFCCQIDDSEGAYLKVLLDEIFGRHNHLTTFYVQVRYGNKTLAENSDYQKMIEQCFVYAKNARLAKAVKEKEPYKVEKFEWEITELEKGKVLELGGKTVEVFKPDQYTIKKVAPHPGGLKETWATGSLVKQTGKFLDKNLAPRKEIDGLSCLYKVYGIGEDGLGYRYMTGPRKDTATKGRFYSGIPLKTLEAIKNGNADKEKPIENFYDMAGSFGNCRHEGAVDFRGGKKPEKLLQLILNHFSREGDIVLDSFGGSGTTAAVAHKMRRQWITVELRDQAFTHIKPRLSRVVNGEDQTGISKAVNWQGGGGFRYYRLAPSMLEKDTWGNWVISKKYNAGMLAEAMCKHMGFTYAPDERYYWIHGHSTETDFIYVTTCSFIHEQLRTISEEVGLNRTLLICCKAFNARPHALDNLTLTKIPHAVLAKYEWGKDDYSLNVAKLERAEDSQAEPDLFAQTSEEASS